MSAKSRIRREREDESCCAAAFIALDPPGGDQSIVQIAKL